MSGRVVLHIGAMKTGTSFLQSALEQEAAALAAEGVDFLGERFAVQTRAVLDGLKLPRDPAANTRRWRRLVAAADPDRTSVVSMEFLSFAGPEQVAGFLEPLAGRRVEVVVTVRDQLAVTPAQWQSYTRNLGTASWADYLEEIRPARTRRRKTRAHRTFHRAQDVGTMVERWSGHPGVDQVTLVTVPRPGAPRDELWRRFCTALGVRPVDLPAEGIKQNESLGYASCDVLRRLNPLLDDVPAPRYRKVVRPLARETLAPLRDGETRAVLDRAGAEYARTRNERFRALMAGDVRVVGGPDDLPVPDSLDAYPRDVEPPRPDDVARAAAAAWDRLAADAGLTGPRPERLDDVLAGAARLVREAATGAR